MLNRKGLLRGENVKKKKEIKHTELKKINIGSFVFFVNLVQQNWFNFSKYNRLANAQCTENTRLGKAFLGQVQLHWGKRGLSAMKTFSLQRPAALAKVIIKSVEWSAHHLAPFNVSETPSKLALKWVFSLAYQVYLLLPGINLVAVGVENWGLGSWKGFNFFRNRPRKCKLLG